MIRFFYINVLLLVCLLLLLSCNNNTAKSNKDVPAPQKNEIHSKKPPSTFPDTLVINYPAAVFFHPDSFQLQKIKAQTDSVVYDGLMHEYFYQMRNAAIVIKKTWPSLSITQAKKYRFLLFKKKNGNSVCIDLDSKSDPYGLIVFNQQKEPLLVDMTNIETDVSFYLK